MKTYIQELTQQVGALSVPHQRAFGLAVATRLLPYYLACEGYGWCRPNLVRSVVAKLGRCAAGDELPSSEVWSLHQQLLESSPDMDECGEFDALDACSALGFSLKSFLPASPSDTPAEFSVCVAEVAFRSTGRTSDYADDDPRFWQDPAVREELSAQQAVLDYLKQVNVVDDVVVAEAMRRATLSASSSSET